MKNLGVEFYRNYIGIEKPLRVDYSCSDNIIKMSGDLLGIHKEYVGLNTDNFTHPCEFEAVKPHLKLPEDLTEDEWLFVALGNNTSDEAEVRHIQKIKSVLVTVETTDNFEYALTFNYLCDNKLTQEQFNRLYSLHSHPQAEEYIENGLAVKIEVKDEE